MKATFYLLSLMLLSACSNIADKKHSVNDTANTLSDSSTNKTNTAENHNIAPAITQDTIRIFNEYDGAVSYTKAQAEKILKYYPELYNEPTLSPDSAYANRGKGFKGQRENLDFLDFESAPGQDNYYMLYAYFLHKKNNSQGDYTALRKSFTQIYSILNNTFHTLAGHGTYFGHMDSHIMAYSEYSVYLYIEAERKNDLNETEDITKPRKLFIDSLKQHITIKLNQNTEIEQQEKPAVKKDLFETVSLFEGLLNKPFYLKSAREFRYSKYH